MNKEQVLKWILCCISAIVGCYPWNLEAFEVKVLLQKSPLAELEQNSCVINAPHGFIISSHPTLSIGTLCNQKDCVVSSCNQQVTINDQQEQMPCYISPALSSKQQLLITTPIVDWFDEQKESLYEQCETLQSFFDTFIEKKSVVNPKSYDKVTAFTKDVFMNFLVDIMEELGDQQPVISLQTLEEQVDLFLKNRVKEKFLTHLVVRQLSKTERNLLQQDVQFRFDFFSHHAVMVAQELLQEFMLVLPRNFLSQILNDDIGYLTLNGNNYLGTFALIKEAGVLYLVNCVDIDDYLLSVVRHEGWPGWPLEMNKVMAITCRTYLVWQVLQAQKLNRPYHIEDNIRHQSYKGHYKDAQLKQAVFDTRDICISHDNKPILAMFDACCGGVVPALIAQEGYKKHPYLLRKKTCTFCKEYKIATWKTTFNHDILLATIQKAVPQITVIDDIQVTKKDPAGLVQKVSIWSQGKVYNLTGKKIYSIFPEVKSFCFDIDSGSKKSLMAKQNSKYKSKSSKKTTATGVAKAEKRFVISGKGYGHHIGLCQWGAMNLVKDCHWNYQKVLQFYYPGTTLIKLKYQR